MAINTTMSGKSIDKNLKVFNDAANAENNNKVLYINDGVLDFEDGSVLFNLAVWEDA